ncbi:MAG TPA: MmgE/PrpD family protein [Candidatus Acidoferrum sp.]|nr:MmgE/PrpD family protein [Candidatus Acidoferrum sp.]
MMDYLDQLAQFVRTTNYVSLPAPVIAAARLVLLDTLGAMLAGSRLPENARLARLVAERSGPRTAVLIGHAGRAEPMLAALSNATAGVALEVDEGNRWGGGHPAIHTLPGLLAVAEEIGADGPQLLAALVAGYDVSSRMGGATTPRFNVHTHGTWGTIGTAVAVAKLFDLDAPAIRQVMNLAVSMSPANSWVPCFEGATIRNLFPGRSGLQGVLAVHLHRCGFTGPVDAPADVYGVILGERFEPDEAVRRLGEEYRIATNYFKLHACCRINHYALDALGRIMRAHRFDAADVEQVTVTSIPFGERMAEPAPATMLAAKFSIPYAVAASLVLGRTDLAAFEDAAVADPRLHRMAARVEIGSDPAMNPRGPADYPTAVVTVALRDGRTLTDATTVVRGDSAAPADLGEIIEKFETLAEPILGAARARAVVEAVDRIDELKNIRDLTSLLSAA